MSSDRYLVEHLPWYLNGTLDEASVTEVERLLAESPENRAELAEAEAAARIYGHRLPTDVLVAYAIDGEHPDVPTELIERYLAVSPVASEELKLVGESLRRLREETSETATIDYVPQVAAAASAGWRRLALAASLVAATALGLVGWQWFQVQNSSHEMATLEQQLRDALARDAAPVDDQALASRLAELEAANEELAAGKGDLVEQVRSQQEAIENLGSQVADLSMPVLNMPVKDVFPGDPLLRGEADEARRLVIPRQTRTAALILNSRLKADQAVTGMHIYAADGRRVWRSDSRPERAELGTFTVAIPVMSLDRGAYTLQLVEEADGQTRVVETYEIEIR